MDTTIGTHNLFPGNIIKTRIAEIFAIHDVALSTESQVRKGNATSFSNLYGTNYERDEVVDFPITTTVSRFASHEICERVP